MDIRKLEGQRSHYRLRVGSYRILFRLIGNRIEVYAVKQRKDAYEWASRTRADSHPRWACCGIGTTPDLKNPLTYQNDAVLACLGNSALRCENAKANLNDALFPTNFQIIKNEDGQSCNFKLSYKPDSTLVDATGQKLAGQYISCPISIVKVLDETKSTPSFSAPSTENLGKYASQIYFYGTLGLFMETNVNKSQIQSLGCSGPYIDTVIASYNNR